VDSGLVVVARQCGGGHLGNGLATTGLDIVVQERSK
jgi:hypothetical protein